MTTLENILQEIEHAIDENMECIYDEDGGTRFVLDSEFARFITKDIIKKHLSDNDGWIPVEDRLPEEPKENPEFENKKLELYLVSVHKTKYPFRAFWNGENFTDGWTKVKALAWRPLPDSYRKDCE